MASHPIDDDAVARADKEMEERANRAKELLSQRYRGLKTQQVGTGASARFGFVFIGKRCVSDSCTLLFSFYDRKDASCERCS